MQSIVKAYDIMQEKTKCGFTMDKGTTGAIEVLRGLAEKVYIIFKFFLKCKKAFDRLE